MLVCLISYINDRNEWTKLTSVVESERIEDGKTSIQTRYYISSLPNDARVLLASVEPLSTGCWTFGEDDTGSGQCHRTYPNAQA